jgi:hypothetical protein
VVDDSNWWSMCERCCRLWRSEYTCRAPCPGYNTALPIELQRALEAAYLMGGWAAASRLYQEQG